MTAPGCLFNELDFPVDVFFFSLYLGTLSSQVSWALGVGKLGTNFGWCSNSLGTPALLQHCTASQEGYLSLEVLLALKLIIFMAMDRAWSRRYACLWQEGEVGDLQGHFQHKP